VVELRFLLLLLTTLPLFGITDDELPRITIQGTLWLDQYFICPSLKDHRCDTTRKAFQIQVLTEGENESMLVGNSWFSSQGVTNNAPLDSIQWAAVD